MIPALAEALTVPLTIGCLVPAEALTVPLTIGCLVPAETALPVLRILGLELVSTGAGALLDLCQDQSSSSSSSLKFSRAAWIPASAVALTVALTIGCGWWVTVETALPVLRILGLDSLSLSSCHLF